MLRMLDLAGVAVFALSGALLGGRKRLDLLGVFVVAAVTAVGGGTIRDLLLDRHPIFWIADPVYLAVTAAVTLGTVAYVRFLRPARPAPLQLALLVADALGLGLFTVSGAQIAEQAGVPASSVVLMGAMTGAAGGVIRDVLCAEIPLVLKRDLYATAAILGATLYALLRGAGIVPGAAGLVASATVVALRLAAIFWGLHLPVFTLAVREETPPSDEPPTGHG